MSDELKEWFKARHGMEEHNHTCYLCGDAAYIRKYIDGTLRFLCDRCNNEREPEIEAHGRENIPDDVPNFGARWIAPPEAVSRPLPCVRANGKTFEKTTLREWLAKLHEEITEMEEKAFGICGLDDYPQKEKLHGTHIETEFALECADVATVLASMQEAFGIDMEARDKAQRRVNMKNRSRGRL